MNTKEKILFIANADYVAQLHANDLDFENHNRLFWCHLAAISFLTSGIADFHLDLGYSYILSGTNLETHELGLTYDKKSVSFITTGNALIEFSLHSSRSSAKINSPIFGQSGCYGFQKNVEKYLEKNLKFKDMSLEEFQSYSFNPLFLKFRIKNRKSEQTQENFITLLDEQCPEINYFINYLKTKDKLVQKNNVIKVKKNKI